MFGYLEVELLVPVVIELYCLTSMTNFRSAHYYWLFLSTYNYSIVCVHITYSGFLKCSEIHIFFYMYYTVLKVPMTLNIFVQNLLICDF